MDPGKVPPFSIRYNANSEELEELYSCNEDDPPTPQLDYGLTPFPDNVLKKPEKHVSILGKYFKGAKVSEKLIEEEQKSTAESSSKETTESTKKSESSGSPMRDYLSRISKRATYTDPVSDSAKDAGNDTWKFFTGFKEKISQAVEDMKLARATEAEIYEKHISKENSISDSEENSIQNELEQISLASTDNQVSSIASSLQNFDDLPINMTPMNQASEELGDSDNTISDENDKNTPVDEPITAKVNVDDSIEIESGVEAIEESTIITDNIEAPSEGVMPNRSSLFDFERLSAYSVNVSSFFTFQMMFFTLLLLISVIFNHTLTVWNAFVIGSWSVTFVGCCKDWICIMLGYGLEPEVKKFGFESSGLLFSNISAVKEHRPSDSDVYEGWMNEFTDGPYNPLRYHISQTKTAFMKLQGTALSISYTRAKVPKRHLWNEKLPKVFFYETKTYDLTGAKITLLPKGLVAKRLWSKKYPLCLILRGSNKVKVEEKQPDIIFGGDPSLSPKKIGSNESAAGPINIFPSDESIKEDSNVECITTPSEQNNELKSDVILTNEGLRKRHLNKNESIDEETKSCDSLRGLKVEMELPVVVCKSASETGLAPLGSKVFQVAIDHLQIIVPETNSDPLKVSMDLDETRVMSELAMAAPSASDLIDLDDLLDNIQPLVTDDSQLFLYIFARTGREKHEWYRRIYTVLNREERAMRVKAEEQLQTAAVKPQEPALNNNEMSVLYESRESNTSLDGTDAKLKFAKIRDKRVSQAVPKDNSRDVNFVEIPLMDFIDVEQEFWTFFKRTLDQYFPEDFTSEVFNRNMDNVTSNSKPRRIIRKVEVGNCGKKKVKNCKESKDKKSEDVDAKEVFVLSSKDVSWLNAMFARFLFDAVRDKRIMDVVEQKIQKKLSTIKLPGFMSPLVVSDVNGGLGCPQIRGASTPRVDERGVWIDLDFFYDGGFTVMITTQMNLMSLKKSQQEQPGVTVLPDADPKILDVPNLEVPKYPKPAIYDSEYEDTAESSSEDEGCPPPTATPPPSLENAEGATISTNETATVSGNAQAANPSAASGSNTKRIIRIMDKITASKYFQQVTENKYVKRAMEGVSNTDLRLNLEVKGLAGCLTLNFPPPPHDRVWFGFRANPQLWLKAKPIVGSRVINFTHITSWIEKRLCKEFEKVLVLPNMEDVVLPFLTPTPVDHEF